MSVHLFDEATLKRLRRLRLSASRVRVGGPRGERLSRRLGSGQEFGGHRAYTRGDDLRRVDWNVYGRLGQLFLKLFEQPGQLRVLLVADDAPTMNFGQHNKWLAARRVLGAVGMISLATAERVLATRMSAREIESYEGSGERRLLESLASWTVRAGGSPSAARGALLERHGRDTLLVLASDFQDREPALSLLDAARRAGVRSVAVSIHAREELRPELDGLTSLRLVGEGTLKIRVDDRVLTAYRQELSRYREGVARAARSAGAAFIEVDSAAPIEPLMLELSRAGILQRPG